MICPFCKQKHNNEGDRYGCPWCAGKGLDVTKDKTITERMRRYRKRDPMVTVQVRVPPERRQELLDIAAQMRREWKEANQ